MSFWNIGKSDDATGKIEDFKKQIQASKHEKDLMNLQKKSDSINKSLWDLKDKIRQKKEEIAIEKSKLESSLHELQTLENHFNSDANDAFRSIADEVNQLKYHEKDYQRKTMELVRKLGDYYRRFCNSGTYPEVINDTYSKKFKGLKMSSDDNQMSKPKDFSLRNG